MELSSALSQRLKNLREWHQSAILVIRKAFTFDDVEFDLDGVFPVLDTGFVPVVEQGGYGLCKDDSYILARPNARTLQIVVTECIRGTRYETTIDVSVERDASADPEGTLRQMIVTFLAAVALASKPVDW